MEEKNDKIIEYMIEILYKLSNELSLHQKSCLIQDIINILLISQNYIWNKNNIIFIIIQSILKEHINFFQYFMASTIFGGPSYISKILNLLENNDLNYYVSEQSLIYPALSMFIFYSDKEVYKKYMPNND